MTKSILIFILTLICSHARAQYNFKSVIKDKSSRELLIGVSITEAGNSRVAAVSDSKGTIWLRNLPAGAHSFVFTYTGYQQQEYISNLPDSSVIEILLDQDEAALEDVVVVASTRNNERIENATTRVEVLGQEEMNEESVVKPANIASILGDISGVQIQQSSAVSGNANVRIQGLDGRYTQLLRDGIPLYDGFSGGFGVLSIAPLDLKQLELIKGAASTLYGGGAIAGLVNFISKKPAYHMDASLVLNHSSLNENNFNGYMARRGKRVGFSIFAGTTTQQAKDIDDDALSNVPKLNSTIIHPVLFFYPSITSYISVGWSGNFEKRRGGDMNAISGKNDSSHRFFEWNDLNRNTLTLIAENRFNSGVTANIKASYSHFGRSLVTGKYRFNAAQDNFFSELSLAANPQRHHIIAGLNITSDAFKPNESTPVPVGNAANSTIGIFAQDGFQLFPSTRVEAGIRVDRHNKYGKFLLPRLAIIHKMDSRWSARTGFGMGYKIPNPLAPQTIDYDINQLQPLGRDVVPEKSLGGNAELNYKRVYKDKKSLFINGTFFLTRITHPLVAIEDSTGKVSFASQSGPVLTRGLDTYIQIAFNAWECYLGYTYTIAERKYLSQNQFMPLTPRHRAATTIVYHAEDNWRFGLEFSYNGRQYRDGDKQTSAYLFAAAMIEKKIGKKLNMVLNCENAFDAKQSNYEKLFTGSSADPHYKPLWAPIDGRIINLALRFQPFSRED